MVSDQRRSRDFYESVSGARVVRDRVPVILALANMRIVLNLGFSTIPIHGSQSYWQISPVVADTGDMEPNAGVATFYHYLPNCPSRR